MSDVVADYLPRSLAELIPAAEIAWRGRLILALWVNGYPLAMAWTIASTDEAEAIEGFKETLSHLDDDRLAADLEATSDRRRSDRIEFVDLS